VAYAVYNGTCLVSPDPVGRPRKPKRLGQFRAFADTQGWALSVLARRDWLRSTARRHARPLRGRRRWSESSVSLSREPFKACDKPQPGAKYGYTISFHDPATLDGALRNELEE